MENKAYYNLEYFQRKEPNILNRVHYFPNEVFAETPLHPDLIIGNFGTLIDKRTGMKRIPYINKNGNPTVSTMFAYEDKGVSTLTVFNAVMLAHNYIDNFKDYRVIHINGNRFQNVYAPGTPWHNLKWIPKSEYQRYLVNSGGRAHGSEATVSSLSDEEVHAICRLMSEGLDNSSILARLGMEDNHQNRYKIVSIRGGIARVDISSQYSFPGPRKNIHHTEEEAHIVCQYLEKYKPLGYNNRDIIRMIEKETGITTVNDMFISALYKRNKAKWKHITDQYNYVYRRYK